mgnify:CR=1 FL=1
MKIDQENMSITGTLAEIYDSCDIDIETKNIIDLLTAYAEQNNLSSIEVRPRSEDYDYESMKVKLSLTNGEDDQSLTIDILDD